LGDVLELGCATGEHGALLLTSGRANTVVGVDRYVPTDAAAQKLTKFHRADIGEWVKSSSEQFDTIIALDVLEHLVDPWTILADCRRLLRPNGLVVASIPNIRFVPVLVDLVGRGRFDYRDAGVLDRTHLRFFTRRSIVAMFDDAGFEALTVRRLANPRRSPLRRLVALGLRDLGCKQFVVLGRESPALPERTGFRPHFARHGRKHAA
jgi:2-polyprenyl-3-methyl-5-hydroxy-6-metoxy-1,4-benzoquinol methylase